MPRTTPTSYDHKVRPLQPDEVRPERCQAGRCLSNGAAPICRATYLYARQGNAAVSRTLALCLPCVKRFYRNHCEPSCCGWCDYDEAEGTLVDQCDTCKAKDAALPEEVRCG